MGGGLSGGDGSGTEEESGPAPSEISLYCSVTMGGENITTQAFDIATGEIEIDEVTGPLVITTWADIKG